MMMSVVNLHGQIVIFTFLQLFNTRSSLMLLNNLSLHVQYPLVYMDH